MNVKMSRAGKCAMNIFTGQKLWIQDVQVQNSTDNN